MTVAQFFELFLEELKTNKNLWAYYKFLTDPKKLLFRKAYFCQRLQYVIDHIGSKQQVIWDCGCGFGTTALFLAMNGYKVFGTTLEYYFTELENREKFWSSYGNTGLFEYAYENLFDSHYPQRFDTVILQDTLHHLEPINEALAIIKKSMRSPGKLIVLEENGSNIIQNLKLIKQRGFRKTKIYYDEKINKPVLFGNENIRSFKKWKSILDRNGFKIDPQSVEFIRLFPSFMFTDYEHTVKKETKWAKNFPGLKKFFYFGMNFCSYP